MKTTMTLIKAVLVALFIALAVTGRADKIDASEIVLAEPGAGLTVYMDVGLGSRKGRAAKKMNELHRAHFARGWQVIDIDPYIENGDLQGFFITYVGREQ